MRPFQADRLADYEDTITDRRRVSPNQSVASLDGSARRNEGVPARHAGLSRAVRWSEEDADRRKLRCATSAGPPPTAVVAFNRPGKSGGTPVVRVAPPYAWSARVAQKRDSSSCNPGPRLLTLGRGSPRESRMDGWVFEDRHSCQGESSSTSHTTHGGLR